MKGKIEINRQNQEITTDWSTDRTEETTEAVIEMEKKHNQ